MLLLAVWLAVTNETGRRVTDVSAGGHTWQVIDAGSTQAGWHDGGAVTLAWNDGQPRRVELSEVPSSDGTYLVKLLPDGSLRSSWEPRMPRPSTANRSVPWAPLAVFAAFLAVLIAAARLLPRLLSRPRREDELARRLGLARQICPIPMFQGDDWLEGRSPAGNRAGLFPDRLWVGEPDEETLWVYERGADGFHGHDACETGHDQLFDGAGVLERLRELSPAVMDVCILAAAAHARLDPKAVTAERVRSDLRVLDSLLAHVAQAEAPLPRAARRGDEAEVRALLKKGADLEARGFDSLGPLFHAARAGRVELVRLLLEAGAKPQPEFGWPIHAAAAAGHLEVVRLLLDGGVSVDQRDAAGDTPLLEAAKNGRWPVVDLLLKRGADPEAANGDGLKPSVYLKRRAA